MNKQYKRNGLEHYMEVESEGGEKYEYQMICENEILNLLPVRIRSVNQTQYLTYEAVSVKPFWIVIDQMWIKGEQFYSLVDSLVSTLEELKRYFLLEDNLVLERDCLFLDAGSFVFKFLYVPGYQKNIFGQMTELADVLMRRIDSTDSEGVLLAYGWYSMLKDGSFAVEELRTYLSQSSFADHGRKSGRTEDIFVGIEKKTAYQEAGFKVEKREPLPQIEYVDQKEVSGKKKNSWKICLSGGLWCILFLGIMGIVFFIYIDGIEVWKRNLLLLLGMGLIADTVLFLSQWRQQKQKQEAEAVFVPMPLPDLPDPLDHSREEWEETTVLTNRDRELRLVFVDPEDTFEISLSKMPFVIGSYSSGVDYRIENPLISRFHVCIFQEGEVFFVKDMHSTNGTFLNGRKLEGEKEEKLCSGDYIELANMKFQFLNGMKN